MFCFSNSDELISKILEFINTIIEADGLQSFSSMLKNTIQKVFF